MSDNVSPEYSFIPTLPLTSRFVEEVTPEEVEDTWGMKIPCARTLPRPISYIVDSFIFLIALYLGSAPSGNLANAPGYGWLSPWVPGSWGLYMRYFYPDIGAILLVALLTHSDFLQKIFTTRISQYLADISLSLYMLHVLVMHTLGNWLIVNCSTMMRPFGNWGFTIGISSKFILCDLDAKLTP